jgi:hypothetical protein
MGVPIPVGAGTGVAITTGTSTVSKTGCTEGNLIFLHTYENGVANDSTRSNITNIESIDGTPEDLSHTDWRDVGPGPSGHHLVSYGRVMADGTCSVDLTVGASGGDVFARLYEVEDVIAGAAVLEDVDFGAANNTTVEDISVTPVTLPAAALNFIAIDTNETVVAYTGETGGDWTEFAAEFATATGAAATLSLQIADMPSGGTIEGGTFTLSGARDYGIQGMALIGTLESLGYRRIIGPQQLATTEEDLYTVPEGRRTRVRHIHLSNPGASEVDVSLRVAPLPTDALLFTNAATDHVSHGSGATLDDINAGTMLAWVYRTGTTSDRMIYMKGNAAELNRAKYLKVNSSDNGQGAGSLQFGMYRATTPMLVEPTGTPVTQDAWTCIATTFDSAGADGDQHIYIGDLDDPLTEPGAYTVRQAGSGTPTSDAEDAFHIGNEMQVSPLRFSFPGRIALLAYWNRVLTLQELREQQYRPHPTSGCVLFASMTTTPTVVDESGNGNDGTVSGATLTDGIPPQMILERPIPAADVYAARRPIEVTLDTGDVVSGFASDTGVVVVIDGVEEAF